MVSGGPDSACAAAALVGVVGAEHVHALHVNYGLRDAADADERTVRRLCAALRIDLHVERLRSGRSSVRGTSRPRRAPPATWRPSASGSAPARTGSPPGTPAPTSPRPSSTASPRRRAAAPCSASARAPGRVVRPLLTLSREQTRALATAAGLPFADDESNADTSFARNRIRADVLPALAELSSEAERNIAETRAELSEEAALLERHGARGARVAPAPERAATAVRGRRALRAGSRRCSASRCAPSPSARRAARCRWAAAAPPRSPGVARDARGRRGPDRRRRQRDLRGRARSASRVAHELDAAPVPEVVALTLPGRCRDRRVGGPGRASSGARPARRPRARDAGRRRARRAARGPDLARGRSHPSARHDRLEDARRPLHRPARCPARSAAACRSSSPAAASPGSRASRSPTSSA